MDFKKGFRPGIANVGISLLATLAVWTLANTLGSRCILIKLGATCQHLPVRILLNDCGCYTWSQLLTEFTLFIAVPFAITYIAVSLIKSRE